MQRTYSVCFISLGCAKNLVDSEVICGVLASDSFVLTTDLRTADVLFINTCGFIVDARHESEEEIRKALRWKRKGRRRLVVVSGCLPQRMSERLAAAFPKVDLFLGLDDVPRAAQLLRDKLEGHDRSRHVPGKSLPTYLYDHRVPRLSLTPASHAFVKIAEGCDHRCAYCAIPLIRGKQRSRNHESILEECAQLLSLGKRELNLIAQDTTRYGTDLAGEIGLPELLNKCGELPGDFWIRVLYTHPAHVNDAFLEAFTTVSKVVPYLDIPLQHISDPILKKMRRKLGGIATRELMERIRTHCPEVTIRTTFLVGFPGETEEDFTELLEYVTEFEFDRLGVFTYSPEEDTPAYTMTDGQVPPELAIERRDRILDVQQRIAQKKNERLVNTETRVLIDSRESEISYLARSYSDAPDVDNVVHVEDPCGTVTEGQFTDVRILEAGPYDLIAAPVGAEDQ